MSDKLIDNLNIIINNYFKELKPGPVLNNPGLVIDENDPILKQIIYNKFNENDTKTRMENENFYKELTKTNHTTYFYLTNGINKQFLSGQDGTNKAITTINNDFFIIDEMEIVFNSNEIVINNNLIDDFQKIKNNNILDTDSYPGTVFYAYIQNFKYKNNYEIKAVYHINGWDHRSRNVESIDGYKLLVKEYYEKIIDHFIKNRSKNSNHMSVLHLIQCPGKIFNGTEITANILITTVKEYLIKNKNTLQTNLNFRISIDYQK